MAPLRAYIRTGVWASTVVVRWLGASAVFILKVSVGPCLHPRMVPAEQGVTSHLRSPRSVGARVGIVLAQRHHVVRVIEGAML